MKFLFSSLLSGGPYWQLKGFANTLTSLGHEIVWWRYNPRDKPILDVVAEHPDIDVAFFNTYPDNLSRDTRKAIRRMDAKIVLYGQTYGKICNDPRYPDLVVDTPTLQDIKNVEEIADRVEFLWIHHWNSDSGIDYVLGGWKNIIKRVIGIPKGFDAIEYAGAEFRPELAADAGGIMGRWTYKSQTLDKYIVPLCHPSQGLNIKIWGGGWHVANCLGTIPEHLAKHVFKSLTVTTNVHERHSQVFGRDVIERPGKTLGAGGFVVSDYVESLVNDYFPNNEIPTAKSPQEYHELVKHFVRNPDDRIPYMKAGRKRVLESLTYHDRVSQIFTELNYPEEAKKVMLAKTELLKKYYD